MKYKSLLPALLIVLASLLTSHLSQAQEILAEVRITTENVTIADRQLVQQMQNDMQTFLNTRSFTSQAYRPDERIRMRLFVGITAIPQNGQYVATARIVSSRPVYRFVAQRFPWLNRPLAFNQVHEVWNRSKVSFAPMSSASLPSRSR